MNILASSLPMIEGWIYWNAWVWWAEWFAKIKWIEVSEISLFCWRRAIPLPGPGGHLNNRQQDINLLPYCTLPCYHHHHPHPHNNCHHDHQVPPHCDHLAHLAPGPPPHPCSGHPGAWGLLHKKIALKYCWYIFSYFVKKCCHIIWQESYTVWVRFSFRPWHL